MGRLEARTGFASKAQGGAPENRCFSHQIFIPHGWADHPEYHVVVVGSWEGFVYSGRAMSPVKDTPIEEALRDMIANWPDKPFWQVPDPSVQQ